jgi:hypothetical protein
MKETKTVEVTDVPYEPDSIDIGTPSKGGAIKIYGNASKPEEFRAKIDEMIRLRLYVQQKLENPTPIPKETTIVSTDPVSVEEFKVKG